MDTPTIRERLINKVLNDLTDEQVDAVLRYADTLQTLTLPEGYDEDNDPSVGFFSGAVDLAERTEEILHEEFGRSRHNHGQGEE